MSHKSIVFVILLLLLAGFAIGYRSTTSNEPKRNRVQNAAYISKTNSEGTVTVKVAPENVSRNGKTWSFRVVLDAHEGSLDENVALLTALTNEEGIRQNPLSWQGDPPGGHHREGIVTFPSFTDTPVSVTLIVANIGGITERRFSWDAQ